MTGLPCRSKTEGSDMKDHAEEGRVDGSSAAQKRPRHISPVDTKVIYSTEHVDTEGSKKKSEWIRRFREFG